MMISSRTLLVFASILTCAPGYALADSVKAARTEVVTPIHRTTFNNEGQSRERKLGGNPRTVDGILRFDGSTDGDRQVDPQIAVGSNHIVHGTNGGFIIYDKEGNFVQGVPLREFGGGCDPKMFYDAHNRVFGFNTWNPWDKEGKKPVNVSVSETADPTGPWNTYPISCVNEVDGGAVSYSRKWVGYSFPGGDQRTFILKMAEVKAGKPATVYHFAGSLGHPVANQDDTDDLYFVNLTKQDIVITRVTAGADGSPEVASVVKKPHGFAHFGSPPASPQKGTDKLTASGDRNPKNVVLQSGSIWFSQAVEVDGRSAVQWHEYKLDGTQVQSGLIAHPKNSYIETSLAVNKNKDVLIGFQETGPDMFISPRCTVHLAGDQPGSNREIISLGEGLGATAGGAWGDYSGSMVDGNNQIDLWTIQSITDKEGKGDTVIARIEPAKIKK